MTAKQKETNASIARILRIFGIVSILAGVALGALVLIDEEIVTGALLVSAGLTTGLFQVWMAQVLVNQGLIIDKLNCKE